MSISLCNLTTQTCVFNQLQACVFHHHFPVRKATCVKWQISQKQPNLCKLQYGERAYPVWFSNSSQLLQIDQLQIYTGQHPFIIR